MPHANVFLTNLAIVLCVAAVTTVLFQRLRQPLVLGYIIAGLLVGPYVPFPLVADSDTIHGLSELGVILLLFGIGLEFTFKKLVRVGAAAAVVALVEISVQIILGDIAGHAFGWTSREALFAGAMMAMSSTTIIAKAFNEMKVGGRVRELVLAVLIVEDLVAILLLTALSTLSAGSLSAGELGMTAGRLLLFLAVVFAGGVLVVPRLVRAVVKLDRPETTSIACIGICFAFALLAQRFDYSVALGAFIAGSLVAESGEGVRNQHLLEPVRDLFAAVFFVSVGMLIDPAMVVANWLPILVLAFVVIAGRIVGVSLPAFLTGQGVAHGDRRQHEHGADRRVFLPHRADGHGHRSDPGVPLPGGRQRLGDHHADHALDDPRRRAGVRLGRSQASARPADVRGALRVVDRQPAHAGTAQVARPAAGAAAARRRGPARGGAGPLGPVFL